MPHICGGRLCDVCRARILALVLENLDRTAISLSKPTEDEVMTRGAVEKSRQKVVGAADVEKHRGTASEDRAALVKMLAENIVSRSVKERIHSRLLSESVTGSKILNTPFGLRDKPNISPATKVEPYSHFSDSSDDEEVESSVDLTDTCSNSPKLPKRGFNEHNERSKGKSLQVFQNPSAEYQELFELEL